MNSFPDLVFHVEDILTEGDQIAGRVRMCGTHSQPFLGVPASGAKVDIQVLDMTRFADGKVAEHWGALDAMALMQQIGAMPPGGPA